MPDTTLNGKGLTNAELVKFLGLPSDIIDKLKTAQGSDYTAASNEFLEALHNKVLYQTVTSMEFTNPFKKYDGFPVNFGDTIENIFVELPDGKKFDPEATDPFNKAKPSVKALYATINYELQYETTIEDSLLRRACLSEYGFMNLIDTLIAALAKSMSIDEYYATLTMLDNPAIYADGIEELSVSSDATVRAATVAKKIVNTVSSFKLPKSINNAKKVMNVCKPSDILLVIKAELLNDINLDYLTGVFNLSKVDLVKNIIEVDGFQTVMDTNGTKTVTGTDIDFVVIDAKGFDNHVALQDGGLIYNPKGKYTNHFYNLWKIVSFKQFHNARAFKLKTVTQ